MEEKRELEPYEKLILRVKKESEAKQKRKTEQSSPEECR